MNRTPAALYSMAGFAACLAAAALAGLGLSGCAHRMPPAWHASTVFNQPLESVYAAIVAHTSAYAPEAVANSLEGTIQTPDIPVDESEFPLAEFAREPWAIGSWTRERFNVRYELRRLGDRQTGVSVVCRFYVFNPHGNGAWYTWPSNGRYEEFLLSEIRQRLGNTVTAMPQPAPQTERTHAQARQGSAPPQS